MPADKKPHTKQEIARLLLKGRVDRMSRFVQLNATPPVILAREAWMIVEAVAMLSSKDMGAVIGEKICDHISLLMGRCQHCDKGEIERPDTLCKDCLSTAADMLYKDEDD